MSDLPNYVIGSGNVFADLELPDADERLAKATLAYRIHKLVEERGWSVADAREHLAVDRHDLSALLGGRLRAFLLERLIFMLIALDQDVEIIVRPNPSSERRAGMTVSAD